MNAKWGRHTIYLYRVQYTEENWPEYDSHRKTKMVYILHIYMSHLLAVTEVSNDAEDRFYSNDSVYFSFSQLFSHFLIAINTSRRFYNEKNTVFFCVGDRPSVLRAYHNNGPFKAWTRIIFAFDGPQWFDDKFEARADVNIVVWFFLYCDLGIYDCCEKHLEFMLILQFQYDFFGRIIQWTWISFLWQNTESDTQCKTIRRVRWWVVWCLKFTTILSIEYYAMPIRLVLFGNLIVRMPAVMRHKISATSSSSASRFYRLTDKWKMNPKIYSAGHTTHNRVIAEAKSIRNPFHYAFISCIIHASIHLIRFV